jgi:hypothetical protein
MHTTECRTILTDEQIIDIIKNCPNESASVLGLTPDGILVGDFARITIKWARAILTAAQPTASQEGDIRDAPTPPYSLERQTPIFTPAQQIDNAYKQEGDVRPVAWYDPANKDAGQSVTFEQSKRDGWPHLFPAALYTSPPNHLSLMRKALEALRHARECVNDLNSAYGAEHLDRVVRICESAIADLRSVLGEHNV